MPGITGIITKEIRGNEEEKLKIMLESMIHESFYTHGTFNRPEDGFFIGYCALNSSFADCMPVFNETRDLVMFLTGECYMDKGILNDLNSHGHLFNPDNASYLIHLYEEKGDAFFSFLNGWYNGIILDFKTGTARLFNDRCGIRRIYIYELDNLFVFASEAKALLRAFPECRKIASDRIGEFLVFDCVLDNRTYFPDINLLPPASVWSFQGERVEKKKYLDMDILENQLPLKKEFFFQELADTFKQVLPRYFIGGPIGMSNTGGLDTRSILACINAPPGKLPCYTFGGTYRDIWDVRLAPKVAKVCGQSHNVFKLDDNILIKNYSALVEQAIYISDGLEGVTKADVISFNKMAREIAPVRMTGKYGSQVLKGLIGFQERPPVADLIEKDFRQYLENASKQYSELKHGNDLTFLFESIIPWWWNGFVALESSQIDVRSPFLDNDLINIMYQAPELESDFGDRFELDLIAQTKPELTAIPTTGTYGGNYPWPISLAIKNWIKLLLILDKVHIREEIPYGMTNLVGRIDYLLSPLHLDKLVMGFSDFRRYRIWFRDQLSDYVRDILLDNKTLSRPYWDKKYMKKIVEDHINGKGTFLREIRKALQVELIHRVLLENI